MRTVERQASTVRVEAVTTTFVASGQPDGVHDLGRFLEMLNNPALSRQIEMCAASIRPLYRAGGQVQLEAPVLVRRDDIIFANFEGPHFVRGTVRPPTIDLPVLLMAPPFQISGIVQFPKGADATQALRTMTQTFFVVRRASVFDADGNALGEGEQIIVNGGLVQMTSASARYIEATAPATTRRRDAHPDAIGLVVPAAPVEEPAAARAA